MGQVFFRPQDDHSNATLLDKPEVAPGELPTTVHLSGGFGFVYMLHFASAMPNIGSWQEYKLGVETYGKWFDPQLRIIDGALSVPKG